jgi:hypothetical protein
MKQANTVAGHDPVLSKKNRSREILIGCTGQVRDSAARYAVRHFSGFEFSLLPGRVHARPHAGNVKPLAGFE